MASYWEQFRGEDDSFWRGVAEGLRARAWWKDGVMVVGNMGVTLKEELEEIKQLRNKWAKEKASCQSDEEQKLMLRLEELARMEGLREEKAVIL